MPAPYAFVSLVTSDHYLPGALALAAALKDVHPSPPTPPEVDFQTVCLVTPETVDVSTIKLLRRAFDIVVGVELIEQEDQKGLQLLGRPDLTHVLTKLHIFRLTQYTKLIFLDADVLPIRPLSHLFTLPADFAAVPDVGWPDIFNSGVLVLAPGDDKFAALTRLLKSKGSWDGGDQGLLNEWRGGDWHRLSFTYNTTPTAAYTYAPAYERFGSQISAIHFIGSHKPWASLPYRAPGVQSAQKPVSGASPTQAAQLLQGETGKQKPQQAYDFDSLVDRWFAVYDKYYRSDAPTARAEFEVRRYASVWDDSSASEMGAEMPPIQVQQMQGSAAGTSAPISGVLGLEDLRKIAVEGIGSGQFSGSTPNVEEGPREGEYRSMPMEGRVDLMRPRREPEPEHKEEGGEGQHDRDLTPRQEEYKPLQSGGGGDDHRLETLRTSGPPPAPYHPGQSSLPTPYFAPQEQGEPSGHRGQAQRGAQQYRRQHDQHDHWDHQQHHDQSHQLYRDEVRQPGHQEQSPHVHQEYRLGQQEHQHDQQYHDQGNQQYYDQGRQQDQGQQQPQTYSQPSHSPSHQHHHHPHSSHDQNHPGQHQGQSPSHSPSQHSPQRHHHHHHHQPPPRPPSPPKLSWNPAIEPPPNNPPSAFGFPADTYFANVWDAAPSQHHDATFQTFDPSPAHVPAPHSDAFFHAPPPAHIPEQLIRQGEYASVIGHASHDHGSAHPTPDRSKVHAVFPWEEKPRHVPRRVFPSSDSPPPSVRYIEEEEPKAPEPPEDTSASVTPSNSRPILHVQTPSPTPGLPGNLAYANAWDSVPSIQRYASRLVRPNQFQFPPHAHHAHHSPHPHTHGTSASPGQRREDEGWRRLERERERFVQAKQDASSMDGDDEDEGDEEDVWEEEARKNEPGGGSASGSRGGSASGSGSTSRRSRANSLASMGTVGKGKKYRARAVQTIPVEMRNQAVQVKISSAEDVALPKSRDAKPSRGSALGSVLGLKRDMSSSPSMPTTLLPPAPMRDFRMADQMGLATPVVTHDLKHTVPFPSAATPTGLRSPQTLGSPRTYSPPKIVTPPNAPSPPRVTSPPKGPTAPRISVTAKSPSPPKIATPPKALSPPKGPTPRRLSSAHQQQFGSPRTGPSPLGTPSSKPASPVVGMSTPSQSTPSPKLSKLASPFSPPLARSSSNDTALTSSPSTQGALATPRISPTITPESTPLMTSMGNDNMGSVRKGGRVWDPARGVDVFKRSSEEVLARFLRMGSFEEDERRQVQQD